MTTISITAVSVSILSAQAVSSSPDVIQRRRCTRSVSPPKPTRTKTIHDSTAAIIRSAVVTISEARSPITRPKRPAIERAEQRQKDDRGVDHCAPQPFIMLMSSTAIEPRLRK